MGEFYVQELDRKPRLEFEKRLMRGGGRAARSARCWMRFGVIVNTYEDHCE